MVTIPKSWDEISVSQYNELINLKVDDYDSDIDYALEKLAILTNTSAQDEYWQEMVYLQLIDLLNSLTFINYPPSGNFKRVINNKYYFRDLEFITLGEFIDAEHFFNELTKFTSILYKQRKEDDFGNPVYENYNSIDLNKRAEVFEEIPITYIFGLQLHYAKFRDKLYEQYAGLFKQQVEDDNFDSEAFFEKNPHLKHLVEDDLKEAEDIDKNENKWGWERLLLFLANNDITKIDSILQMPLYFVFNMLGMRQELNL